MLNYITSFIWSNTVEEIDSKSHLDDYIRSKNVSYFSYSKDKEKFNRCVFGDLIDVIVRFDVVQSEINKKSHNEIQKPLLIPDMPKLKMNNDEMISYVDSLYLYATSRLGRSLNLRESEIIGDKVRKIIDDGAPVIHATATITKGASCELQKALDERFGVEKQEVIKSQMKLIDDFNQRKKIIEETLHFSPAKPSRTELEVPASRELSNEGVSQLQK